MRKLWAIISMMFGTVLLAPAGVVVAQSKADTEKPPQTKPALLVETFTAAPGVAWPYDMKLLQSQTVAELKGKDRFNVVTDVAAESEDVVYRLQGEVVEWHAG